MWDSVRSMLGNGLVVSEGDLWMRQRRMMQPQFHRQNLNRMIDVMLNAINAGLRHWDAWADSGEAMNVVNAFNQVTLRVIVRAMFGEELSSDDANLIAYEMACALDYLLQNMVMQHVPTWIPVPGRKRYQESIQMIDDFLYRIIAQRRESYSQPKDMLGMLLQLVDEETGATMTDKQIRDEIATLFRAGYETTSLTLSWSVHHLMTHPRIAARLQAEIDSVLGGQAPTLESLERLPYTRSMLQEIMRIHPPAFWIPHTALTDDEIGGFPIKGGQMVGVSIFTIHRNPAIWQNPDSFQPERFSSDCGSQRHQLAWMPFGAGQRTCIGRDFALMEGTLILVRLMQQYNLISGGREAVPSLTSTLRPKDGVWARLEKRA